jgi:glycosyltransferase A (GT-A) superfamily protein (DUF2064 family)
MSAATSSALVLLAKWPGSGSAKTRLAAQIASASTDITPDDARRWAAAFMRAAVSDLASRFGGAASASGWQCVLLYAPPVDEARAYFAGLLAEAGVADAWRLLPVLSSSNAKSSDLGAILADAAARARAACGTGRVAFFGADCPELPLASVAYATAATADPRVAAICPASDGGYTLLALPEEADAARCFEGVHWSADDTCLSQLAAISRTGLLSLVGETHADVDELDDLRALSARLSARSTADAPTPSAERCPQCAALLAEMTAAGVL